jgi:copper(I)-binding protein
MRTGAAGLEEQSNMKNAVCRMRRAVVAAAVLISCAAAVPTAQEKPITATDAWVKLPEPGAKATEAYATVNNPGMYAIYLVSGTTDVAGKVEFRDASKANAPQEDVTVIAYESTYMDPKGVHMYLSDLKKELKEGDTVYITLKTEAGIPIEVEAKVKKP